MGGVPLPLPLLVLLPAVGAGLQLDLGERYGGGMGGYGSRGVPIPTDVPVVSPSPLMSPLMLSPDVPIPMMSPCCPLLSPMMSPLMLSP